MNELRIFKKAMSLFFVIAFLCMGNTSIQAQMLDLDAILANKIDPGDNPTWDNSGGENKSACEIKPSAHGYTIIFTIKNNNSYPVDITDFTADLNPGNWYEPYFGPFQGVVIAANSSKTYYMPYKPLAGGVGIADLTGIISIDYNLILPNKTFAKSDDFIANIGVCENVMDNTMPDKENRFNNSSSVNELKVSPNPVSDNFQLNYTISELSDVNVILYNSIGQNVSTIINQKQEKGTYYLKDIPLLDFDSGIYYLVLRAGNKVITEKIVKL